MEQSHRNGSFFAGGRSDRIAPSDRIARPSRVARRLPLLLLLLPVLLWGCVGPTDSTESLVWEGSLQPLEDAPFPVTGSVAMVAGQVNTQLGIGAVGAEPGTVLRWSVHHGDCSTRGEPLADAALFPPIDVDTSGEGDSELVLAGRVPASQTYGAWVAPPDAADAPVACGVLDLRD